MTKTLKTVALAMLLTGATAMTSTAETLYQTLSVDLVLTYQGTADDSTATKGSSVGEVKDVAGQTKLSTSEFMQLLALNLHQTLNKNATIVRVTTLMPGTNWRSIITNSTTLQTGYTVMTNIAYPAVIWQTLNATNVFVVTPSPGMVPSPATNYSLYGVTNYTNFVIQGIPESVWLGTAVQYYIHNASNFKDTNFADSSVWIPLSITNTDTGGGVSISTLDQAPNFLNKHVIAPNQVLAIDDQNEIHFGTNYYFQDSYYASNTVYEQENLLTNLTMNVDGSGVGPIFVGTIKSNMAISGTIYNDTLSMGVGYPFEPLNTTNFLTHLSLSGSGNATATTSTAGKGKAAMPFTSWNCTFSVSGSGWLGGVDSNYITSTNFLYGATTNGPVTESAGFYANGIGYTTNTNPVPPATFTNSFIYVSGNKTYTYSYFGGAAPATVITNVTTADMETNGYTGFSTGAVVTNVYTNILTNIYTYEYTYYETNLTVTNYTNSTFTLQGTVKQHDFSWAALMLNIEVP